ncbi:hypothetical protein ABW21_db0202766 [Orbilia brochopaga]|nr:hypothetical protein ABW21_db0202766 [Drechslerella brochopaga]
MFLESTTIRALRLVIPRSSSFLSTHRTTALNPPRRHLHILTGTEAISAINKETMSDAHDSFRQQLAQMPKAQLNRLDMGSYNRTERRLIDEERVRRKRANTATASSPPEQSQVQDETFIVNALGSLLLDDTSNQASGSSNARPPKPPKDTPESWYLYPEHHTKIAEQIPGVPFYESDANGVNSWDTRIVGKFECSNRRCEKTWTSGIVATVIRAYRRPELSYNAKVYNQRCKKCNKLGHMKIDVDSYVERVVRRIKIWKGETVPEIPDRVKITPPHEEDFCEGCKAGRCQRKYLLGS